MGTDVKLARTALKASGLNGCATTLSLLLPFGRERRVQALLRKRHAVLEAKNNLLDSLFRLQRPLDHLGLRTQEHVKRAMADPEKRRMILTLGLSRPVLEDEVRKWGTELGPSFDQALRELLAAGRLLRAATPAGDEVYLIVPHLARQRYDMSAINRLLQQGRDYGKLLRVRDQESDHTNVGRTYRM